MSSRGYDGTIKIDTSVDSKGFNTGVKSMSGMIGKLTAAAAAFIAVLAGAKAISAVAKLSSEFQRLQFSAQAVGQLHGVTAAATRELTSALIDAGIQTDTANRAFINFTREGLDTSLLPALARGAQDLNVFSEAGESSSDVLDRLSTGILNLNSLMLRRAGIAVDVNEAEKAYGETIGKTVAQMSIQEKRQAVLLAVTEKMKGINGLYELSQKTAAGQMASNIRVTNELKAALGAPLQDALYRLIKAWNSLLKAMTKAISAGGRLHAAFVKIGAVASVLASIIASLFNALAGLFGLKASAKMADDMGDVAGGTEDAASGMGDLADNTEAAGKAAKGALASFDELNVLQQNDAGGAGSGDGGALGGIGEIDSSQWTNPMDEIIAKADELKAKLLENDLVIAFLDLLSAAGGLLLAILQALEPYWTWFWENVLVPLGKWTGGAIVEILDSITWALERMTEMIENGDGSIWVLIATASVFILTMLALGAPIWLVVLAIIALIVIIKNWGAIWDWIVEKVTKAWETLKQLWFIAGYYFKQKVTEPIKEAFISAFTAVKDFVYGVINSIIGFINRMISGIIGGINSVIGAANSVGSIVPGYAPIGQLAVPQIPYLATGAVIPPNAQFAAILGDNKKENEILAPESTLRQIMREELGGRREQNINIKFTGSLAELARILKPVIDKENGRIGGSLIAGGVA